MLPDYSRTHDVRLKHLKLFLHLDILQTLQHYFLDALPDYSNRNEKPATYDADPGNYAKQVYNLHLRDSLICFLQQKIVKEKENENRAEYFTKTVALQGQVYCNYTYEKPNQIKESMFEMWR